MFFFNNYSLIDSHSTKNISSKILQKTKQLTLSREKYNSFLDLSINSREKRFHKLPPLNLKHSESQKNIQEKSENIFEKIILPYKNKNPLKNKNLQNKRVKPQFFLSELRETNNNTDKNDLSKNEFNKNNIIKIRKILKYPRTKKYIQSKNINNLSQFNKQKKEDQIYFLIDSIFSDKKGNIKEEQTKYEEDDIFGHRDKYITFLGNELSLLYKGEKELDKKSNLLCEYDNRIYGKIRLELKSANILISDKETEEIFYSIDIPFIMLCLFFLSHIKELTYIVLGLFSNENFMEIDENNLLIKLKEIIMNHISFENGILKYNNNIDDEDRKTIFDEFLNKRNLRNRSNIKYNFLSLFSKKEAFKQIIFENCTFNKDNIINIFDTNLRENLSYRSNSRETLKILFDTNINIMNFSWISLNHNYNIKITMPQIIIYIDKFKKEVNHFINKELLVYLMMNEFKNFNFLVIHYLFTLQNFRTGINKALSYYNLFYLYPFFSKIIKNENYNANLIYEKYHISNVRFEEYENSLNDNEYIFYVSDDDSFHLYKMKSYSLFIYPLESLEEMNNPKIYFFNFSFYQMKVLFYKSKYDNLLQFLQRLLKYNPIRKKIFLDYSFFNSFKFMNAEQIDRYFKESSFKKLENIKNVEEEIIQNDLVLRVLEPKFISVSVKKAQNDIDEKKMEGVKKVGNVGIKLCEKLIESDIKDWGKILWENKDDIELLKNKRGKINSFGGKKDFKTIFKKFLKIN